MRMSDWSSDVCSSDLGAGAAGNQGEALAQHGPRGQRLAVERAGLQGKQARERGIVRSLGQHVTAGAQGVGEALLLAGVTAQRDHAVFEHQRRGGVGVGRDQRSEVRRVGKGSVSTYMSRWSPYHLNKKHTTPTHSQQQSDLQTSIL